MTNAPIPVRKRRFNYLLPIAVVAGVILAVITSSKSWRVYQQEKQKATDMRQELEGYKKSQLRQKMNEQFLNPVQKEEEARKMGFVKPNEAPLK